MLPKWILYFTVFFYLKYYVTGQSVNSNSSTFLDDRGSMGPPTINNFVETIIVKKGDQINITCLVQDVPTPEVVWLKDKTPLSSEIYVINDHTFKVEADFHHGGNYTCVATNIRGSAVRTVEVLVYTLHITPPVGKKTVKVNKTLTIDCEVEGIPKPDLKWIFYSYDKTFVPEILPTTEGTLTIKKIRDNQRGAYVCVASNIGCTLNITHEVDVLFPPVIQSSLKKEFTAVDGDSLLKIHCRATGNPPPVIAWWKNGVSLNAGTRYHMEEDCLIIKNVEKSDASEFYYCEAKNDIGTDTGIFKVLVYNPPTIKNYVETIIVKKGDQIDMKCLVQGVPTPEVVWHKDAMPLGSEINVFRDHSFKIQADFRREGNYTCTASNTFGSAVRTVEVLVYSLHITSPSGTLSVKVNKTIILYCDAEGVPKPDLKWIFYSYDKTIAPEILSTTEGTLTIKKIKDSHRGAYECVASNIGGTLNITHEVDVLSPPEIQLDLKKEYWAVEGDSLLKIHCRATGNPRPIITWWKNGTVLAAGSKYNMKEDWLIIKTVETSDTSEYKCEAKNYISQDTGTFTVKVYSHPPADLYKTTISVLIVDGERAQIQCYIPHKKDDLVVWYKDGKTCYKGGILEIHKVKPTDSGVYTCRVSYADYPPMESAKMIVEVISIPKVKVVALKNTEVELEFGQSGYLTCTDFDEPEPTEIFWWHNNVSMKFSESVYNFKMDTETIGEYRCDSGNVSRTFYVSLKGCVLKIDNYSRDQPLMLTTSGEWPAFEVIDGSIFLPKKFPCKELLLSSGTSSPYYFVDNATLNHVTVNRSSAGRLTYLLMHAAVQADHNVLIRLTQRETWDYSDIIFDLDVGFGRNLYTQLDLYSHGTWRENVEKIHTPNIPSSTDFGAFYIKIDDGKLQFGREGDSSPLFSHTDNNLSEVNYFQFYYGGDNKAKIRHDCPASV